MIQSIIGTKINQTQVFDENGIRWPVTKINVGPCYVVDIKTIERDGYNALKLGIGNKRIKNFTRPELGVIKKAGLEKNPPRFLKEVEIADTNELTENIKPGAVLDINEIFKIGDSIQVTGVSKGHGFAGVVKRHHFKGGPRTHGQSDRERSPGSIGQTTTPGRVYKGKRMAGRMGNDQVTLKGLKIFALDAQKNELTVTGLIPGVRNSLVVVSKQKK